MKSPATRLSTRRGVLRRWHDNDRVAFAAMNADAEVMHDLDGTLGRDEVDRKLDRYTETFDTYGYGRWVIEGSIDKLRPASWATQESCRIEVTIHWETMKAWAGACAVRHGDTASPRAARAALHDVFRRVGLTKAVSYTAPDHFRSQAGIRRLGRRRHSSLDFSAHYAGFGTWHGLVWLATPTSSFTAADVN